MSSKLQYRYTGPHTITAVINPVTYKSSMDGFNRTVHANRMKRDSRREISRAHIHQARLTKKKARRCKPQSRMTQNPDPEPEVDGTGPMDDVPLPANTFQVEPDDGAEAQLVLCNVCVRCIHRGNRHTATKLGGRHSARGIPPTTPKQVQSHPDDPSGYHSTSARHDDDATRPRSR